MNKDWTSTEVGNPFAIPDLWEESSFMNAEQQTSALDDLDSRLWQLELSLGKIEYSAKPLLNLDYDQEFFNDFGTLSLDPIVDGSPEDLASPESLASSFSDVGTDHEKPAENDIWSAPDFLALEKLPSKSRTWESFYDDGFQDDRVCYISEAGPKSLDAVLSLRELEQKSIVTKHPVARILKSEPLLTGFLQLALGRDSMIFHYVKPEMSFKSRFGDVRMSGYCPETFAGLTDEIVSFANRLKALHIFVEDIYTRNRTSRTLIALGDHLSGILRALKARLYWSSQEVATVLQLQDMIREPDLLLACLSNLVSQLKTKEGDEEVLSTLYRFAQDLDHSTWLRSTILDILGHSTRPWLLGLSHWMGLEPDHNSLDSSSFPKFVHETATIIKDDHGKESTAYEREFDDSTLPEFVTVEEAEAIFEVGQSLCLLRAHEPQHPAAHVRSTARSERPKLEMQLTWQDIERIETQAKAYEADVLAAIKSFDVGKQITISDTDPDIGHLTGPADTSVGPDEAPDTYIARSITEIEEFLPKLLTDNDLHLPDVTLWSAPNSISMQDSSFPPPVSLLPSLSFSPLISAQSRLINQSTLRLLFKDHSLRSHLTLQYRYQLLGDGVFASRLSHALFDAEIPSAERKKGNPRVGTSGLKLGARESWPPASSELRLALTGILSDSYHHTETAASSTHRSADLPGGLSFAIRAMSEGELQRCMDPNSISALDFLRLQYKPPAPLDAVISAGSLEKYDTIFKLLLRANRMMYAVTHFPRASRDSDVVAQRFKIEAHHLMTCVCSYLFENVTMLWSAFEKKLDTLETRIEKYEIGEYDRLTRLRDLHDGMLDELMFALLLRKRQETVMGLLEEIFSLVLAFAHRERCGDGEALRDEYERFRKKVKVFLSVCRGLSERKAFAGVGSAGAGDEGGGGIGRLLLRLEMSGYYTRVIR